MIRVSKGIGMRLSFKKKNLKYFTKGYVILDEIEQIVLRLKISEAFVRNVLYTY